MDVQVDAALEAMSDTGSAAEGGATGPTSLPVLPSPSSKSSQSSPNTSPESSSFPRVGETPELTGVLPPPQQGYPKEIIQGEVEEKFLCGFCDNILREPQQSQCGHRFCKICNIKKQQLAQPVTCQACIKEEMSEEESVLDLASMFDDKAAIREMRKLQVKCINLNCTWAGTFQEYISKHETDCDKKMLACPLCGTVMSQNKLPNHVGKLCPKRKVTCPYCKQQMLQEQEEKHKMTCPIVPVKCDRCSASVPRNEFENHQDRDCIHRDIVCPVPDCKKKMPKIDFPAHLNENPKTAQRHLLFLFDKITELELELHQLQLQPPPVEINRREQEVAASAEARDGLDQRQNEQQSSHGAVGGTDNAAGGEPEVGAKLKLYEELMTVLHGEILRCIRQLEAFATKRERDTTIIRNLEGKMNEVERSMGVVEIRLKELQPLRSPGSEAEVGTLVEVGESCATWCIPKFSQVRRAAVNGNLVSVDSPAFMTGSLGYKLRMRLFPDGNLAAKGEALSVYLNLLSGPCDDLLPWPFEADVHFLLIDHKDFRSHKIGSIRSPKTESSCQRPSADGVPQLGFGLENLVTFKEMGNAKSGYNLKDNVYLRVTIDLKLLQDRQRSLDPRLQGMMSSRPQDRVSPRK